MEGKRRKMNRARTLTEKNRLLVIFLGPVVPLFGKFYL